VNIQEISRHWGKIQWLQITEASMNEIMDPIVPVLWHEPLASE